MTNRFFYYSASNVDRERILRAFSDKAKRSGLRSVVMAELSSELKSGGARAELQALEITAEPEEPLQPAKDWDFDQSLTFDEP